MAIYNFITVRLGKDSLPDIDKICKSNVGVLKEVFVINVKCTQIPDNYKPGDYAFIWLGSDNNKGMPTKWKQGFKAVGRVKSIIRGKSYNDISETSIDIVYVFQDAINRLDILRSAPIAYYWCSSLPLIGIDDHANQTIRSMSSSAYSDIRAFFVVIESVTNRFRSDIVQIEPAFDAFFELTLPNPRKYPFIKNLEELDIQSDTKSQYSFQQIFYGAPGTGKSNTIKRVVDDKHKTNFRVTFHPDSDYSTFVGCYKPTMKVNTISKNGVETKEEQIVYRFVPQAFTKAYTAAWNTEDDVYLIIEEINRGNCAQIFGDLFQLLDRKDGVSEYPVDADSDLADYIRKELKDSQRDFPEGVKDGKKLVLPSNLYIWATMNTSDQSLFPIDSAFKRRWDWKYMKIKDEHKEWKVDIDIKSKDAEGNETSKKLDWWTFVDKINKIIASMTSSADKQLGYFFCKATKKTNDSDAEPTIITKDTFVSKVIFYLWNDVFKDYGFEDASLFRYKEVNPDTNKEEEKDLTFPDFYDEAGEEVNTKRLTDFVDKVLNWQQTKEEQK